MRASDIFGGDEIWICGCGGCVWWIGNGVW